MWDEITYPSINLNGARVDVWERISDFISSFTILLHAGLKLNDASKRDPRKVVIASTSIDWTNENGQLAVYYEWSLHQADLNALRKLAFTSEKHLEKKLCILSHRGGFISTIWKRSFISLGIIPLLLCIAECNLHVNLVHQFYSLIIKVIEII